MALENIWTVIRGGCSPGVMISFISIALSGPTKVGLEKEKALESEQPIATITDSPTAIEVLWSNGESTILTTFAGRDELAIVVVLFGACRFASLQFSH